MEQKFYRNTLFFNDLNDEEFQQLDKFLELKEYPPDYTLFKENDKGDYLYVLVEGYLSLYKKNFLNEEVKISDVYPPSLIGEMALMSMVQGSTRTATGITNSPAKLIALSRFNFTRYTTNCPNGAIKILKFIIFNIVDRVKLLDKALIATNNKLDSKNNKIYKINKPIQELLTYIPFFSGLDKNLLINVIYPLLEINEYNEGEVIFLEGTKGDRIYFLIEGEIAIVKDYNTSNPVYLTTVYPLNSLGEMALIKEELRITSAIAETKVKTISLSKENFDKIININPTLGVSILKCFARITSNILRNTLETFVDAI